MCWLAAKSRGAASASADGRMTDTQQGDDKHCSKVVDMQHISASQTPSQTFCQVLACPGDHLQVTTYICSSAFIQVVTSEGEH